MSGRKNDVILDALFHKVNEKVSPPSTNFRSSLIVGEKFFVMDLGKRVVWVEIT